MHERRLIHWNGNVIKQCDVCRKSGHVAWQRLKIKKIVVTVDEINIIIYRATMVVFVSSEEVSRQLNC